MFPVGKYSLLFLFAGTSKEVPAFIFSGDDLNMNTFEKRSRYFRELSLYLQRNGFTTQDMLMVALTSRMEPEDTKNITWLYLPAAKEQLERAMGRSGINDPENMRFRFAECMFPDEVKAVLDFQSEGLFTLNELAQAVTKLSCADQRKLGTVVTMAEPGCATQIRQLAENLDQFDFISMDFWTDSKVVDDFTPEDRYIYLYCMTNPHTNLCGCYEVSIKQIANETGYNNDTVERLLKRLDTVTIRGSVLLDSLCSLIWLESWSWIAWATSMLQPAPSVSSRIDSKTSRCSAADIGGSTWKTASINSWWISLGFLV